MSYYTQDNFDRIDSVGFSLNKARNVIMVDVDIALKELNVKARHIGILMSLFRGTAKTPGDISRHLGLDSGLMTRLLDSLEKQGLLARSRGGKDRRTVNLHLTEAGSAIALRIADIVPDVLNARLRSFSAVEFEELCRLLGKLLSE